MSENIPVIAQRVLKWLGNFAVPLKLSENGLIAPLDGQFSLHPGAKISDLYGMLDAVYILYTLGRLKELTSSSSRKKWADRILACQDEDGWFTKLSFRGHPKEHATAYAIGALKLLKAHDEVDYLARIQPIRSLRSILANCSTFENWMSHMGFWSIRDIPKKSLGWHYIWRGSHVGGGVAAAIGMLSKHLQEWWDDSVDVEQWFGWYFNWLDRRASAKSGLWQKAFWNLFYHKPTLIDIGGAAHFLWIYEARNQTFPYPQALITSTLGLQQKNGLYSDHPFCIDLDANHALIRAYCQIPSSDQQRLKPRVHKAVLTNFAAISKFLLKMPLSKVYPDTHGLPGALIALKECERLPGLNQELGVGAWDHVLDNVWWL